MNYEPHEAEEQFSEAELRILRRSWKIEENRNKNRRLSMTDKDVTYDEKVNFIHDVLHHILPDYQQTLTNGTPHITPSRVLVEKAAKYASDLLEGDYADSAPTNE